MEWINKSGMIDIQIADTIRTRLPGIKLGVLSAEVRVGPSPAALLDYIDGIVESTVRRLTVEDITGEKVIAATRKAYRLLGKDPSRYRPSAEALTRRVVQGKGLYRVNNVVDALNAISLKTGYSIGGYDMSRLGSPVVLDIGSTDEPYEAIGRGSLNIANLPVLRDQDGSFGSPTSDSERTMVRETTREFLMIFFDFQSSEYLQAALEEAAQAYSVYTIATRLRTGILK